MLRGRDGVHQWESPGGLTIVLNELDDLSTGDAVYPRFRLVDVDHGYPEAGDNSDKRVGASGSIPRASYRGPRTHVYTIEVYGRTIDELREGEQTLRGAFFDQSAEGRMDVNLHPLHDDYDAGNNRFFNARAMALTPGTDAPDSDLSPSLGFRREWVLALRNHDGRYFEDLTPAGFKQAIIDLGPSLYWALDSVDGVNDLSPNDRDGFAGGSITIGASGGLTSIPGDSATDFDGIDDFISSQWDPWDPAGERTVLVFVKRDSLASTEDIIIGTSDSDVCLRFSSGNNNITWQGDAIAGVEATWLGPAPTQAAFLALTVRDEYPSASEATVSLYLDGAVISAETVGDLAPASNFVVGDTASSPPDKAFDGKMSHVAVFERILIAEEIATVYEWASTGLRAYW